MLRGKLVLRRRGFFAGVGEITEAWSLGGVGGDGLGKHMVHETRGQFRKRAEPFMRFAVHTYRTF